jgi:hypothetical protein
MTPRERFLKTARGETADRVPLMLEGFHVQSLDDVGDDTARRALIERVFDETHYFVGTNSYVNRYLVTPPQAMSQVDQTEEDGVVTTTTAIHTPKGNLTAVTSRNPDTNTVWTVKYPVESLEDIEKIRSVPWELPPKLSPPDLSDLPDDFERRGIVRGGVSSPFVCVGGMMPYQYFLALCGTELELMKELTEQCCERIADVLGVLLSEENIEYMWIGGCEWLTPPMASPRLYEELVQPYEEIVIGHIHAAGGLAHVHCHGKVRETLELVIQRGGDLFEPVEPAPDGDITMAEAKERAAGRITLAGNIEARVLENEDADTVEVAVRAAFEGGKERMALRNTAGPIGEITPRMSENYNRLFDVWEELSPI